MARCRLLAEEGDLVAPLGQGQKQRQQDGADQQPLAHRHIDGGAPGRRPDHETERNREHVEDDLSLESE
jgi:hypothetical protein